MKKFGALSHSLISKFIFRTGLVLLLTISLFASFNISTLKEVFLQDAKDDVETLSEIILHTTHFQMLEDNRTRVYEMIDEVTQHEKIDRVRLYSTEGYVHFSTQGDEIGKTKEELRFNDQGDVSEEMTAESNSQNSNRRIFVNSQGVEILSVTTEIDNKSDLLYRGLSCALTRNQDAWLPGGSGDPGENRCTGQCLPGQHRDLWRDSDADHHHLPELDDAKHGYRPGP